MWDTYYLPLFLDFIKRFLINALPADMSHTLYESNEDSKSDPIEFVSKKTNKKKKGLEDQLSLEHLPPKGRNKLNDLNPDGIGEHIEEFSSIGVIFLCYS